MFSVIIPTKDEETNLGTLLQDISKQTQKPKEIIVADKSTDNTRIIAKRFGAKIVEGNNKHHIGIARNNGAKVATTDILVFIDADTRIDNPEFFAKLLHHFNQKKLDIATCYFKPIPASPSHSLIFSYINTQKRLGSIISKPVSEYGALIIMKKEVFEKLNGFSGIIMIGEDHDLILRAAQEGMKFKVIPLKIGVSTRRYQNKSAREFIKMLISSSKLAQDNKSKKLTETEKQKLGKDYWG